VRNVLNNLVDLGIIAFPVSNPALTLVPVSTGRLVLVCPPGHEFAQRRKIQAVELSGRGFVLFEPGMPLRRATDKILNSHSVKICVIASFANINVVKLAVEAGFGLAVVPHSSVAYEERSKRLSIVELAEYDWVYHLGIVYRKGQKLSSAAWRFVKLLEREVKK